MELSNLIEVMTSTSIATIVTTMTIALPLIVTAIHKLVETYKTNFVMTVFNKDWALRVFRVLLIASLAAVVVWVVLFFRDSECLCCFSIILCVITLLLLVSLILLVARIVYYALPQKFIQLIFSKINRAKYPTYYFEKETYIPLRDKEKEKKRFENYSKVLEYDAQETGLYVILSRAYWLSEEPIRNKIRTFWEKKCRDASLVKENKNYYTNGYYNFIHELETIAVDKHDVKLQVEAINFTNIFLSAHLPVPEKYGEPHDRTDRRRFISSETLESLWITILNSLDGGDDRMFEKYWQIVNNYCSRKYDTVGIEIAYDFDREYVTMYVLHFACCAYIIYKKRYDLLKHAFNYSQSYPLKWILLPKDYNEIIQVYLHTRNQYEDWTYSEHFRFRKDYNIYSEILALSSLEIFASLLLYMKFEKRSIDVVELRAKDKEKIKKLITYVDSFQNNRELIEALGIEEDFLSSKQEIITTLESLTIEKETKKEENTQESKNEYKCDKLFETMIKALDDFKKECLSFFGEIISNIRSK